MANITFIGLGQMGFPMAHNLIKGGHNLSAWDTNKEAAEKLESLGAKPIKTLEQTIVESDFVITMLPNGAVVKDVLFGDDGVVHYASQDTIFIDMSTIHPLESDELREKLQDKGMFFIDAPVGRTSDHAIAGTLVILAGGSHEQINKCNDIFKYMGDTIIDCGGPGMGIRIKIINNLMSISLNALSAEVITLAEKLGLKYENVMEVFNGTPAGNGHFKTTWPNKVLKGDLSPAFMVDLAHKDMLLALDVAQKVGVNIPMAAQAANNYSIAQKNGRGREDWTSILAEWREQSGL